MAYAMLSSLPPICGLYISFFGPLVYFFLGTSKHVSMGKMYCLKCITRLLKFAYFIFYYFKIICRTMVNRQITYIRYTIRNILHKASKYFVNFWLLFWWGFFNEPILTVTLLFVSTGCISIVSLMIASVLDDALSYSGLNTDQSLIAQNLTAHAVLSSPEYNMSNYSQSNSTVEGFPLPGVSQGQLPDTPINRFKIELASALSLISGITMVTVTSCTGFTNCYWSTKYMFKR